MEKMENVEPAIQDGNPDESKIQSGEDNKNPGEHPCKQILKVWKSLIIILTPIILLPLPILWPGKVSQD